MSSVSALLLTRRRSVRALPLRRGDSRLQRVRHQFFTGVDRCHRPQTEQRFLERVEEPRFCFEQSRSRRCNTQRDLVNGLVALRPGQQLGFRCRYAAQESGCWGGCWKAEYTIVMRGRSLEFIFQTGKMLTR